MKSYGISDNSKFSVIGTSESSALTNDKDKMAKGMKEMSSGEGTQSGSHPAKTQSTIMHFMD
jgi:hypothetical protein